MAGVERLLTLVDIAGVPERGRMVISARHEAVLSDGRRLLLLDDRGWAAELSDGGDVWAASSISDVEADARTVVGPDEPVDGVSYEAEATGHWRSLAERIRLHGIAVDPSLLPRLPHDVVLSERLRARLPPDPP